MPGLKRILWILPCSHGAGCSAAAWEVSHGVDTMREGSLEHSGRELREQAYTLTGELMRAFLKEVADINPSQWRGITLFQWGKVQQRPGGEQEPTHLLKGWQLKSWINGWNGIQAKVNKSILEKRMKGWDANVIGMVLGSEGSCSLFWWLLFFLKAGAQELSFKWEVRVRKWEV